MSGSDVEGGDGRMKCILEFINIDPPSQKLLFPWVFDILLLVVVYVGSFFFYSHSGWSLLAQYIDHCICLV